MSSECLFLKKMKNENNYVYWVESYSSKIKENDLKNENKTYWKYF